MTNVLIDDPLRELHFDRYDSMIAALHNQVDFAQVGACPQVLDSGFSGLGKDANAQGDERLEQMAEQRAVAGDGRSKRTGVEGCLHVSTEESGSKRRIGKLMFWAGQSGERSDFGRVATQEPVDDPETLQRIPIGLCRGLGWLV
jgi:hypothetical protein